MPTNWWLRLDLLLGFGSLLLRCTPTPTPLFTQLNASQTGIEFANTLVETPERNILTYEYLYNGGGVGIGDFNNDGQPDIYFTGNTVANRLYLNTGNFQFKDITAQAGVEGKNAWTTGVSIADVNGDGWLDIYVCYSGLGTDADRADQLFINNGVKAGIPTFTDRAHEYGLDAPGTFTTQAAFFDYDLDGDLDMFQLNHANQFYSPFFNTRKLRQARHPLYGNRLYRNDANHFTEVSTEAGILGSGLNYGLGIAIADLNQDGWPDIYVTNDYEEQDFLYLNNHNGTFREVVKQSFGHISKYAMGVDVGDINNDARPDIVTMDMLPEDNHRQKLLRGPDEYDKYKLAVDSGYHRQQMRNMLQLNQGQLPMGEPVFSDIGQLAGISNTDWSWSALLADYDNDGRKDLYVTNGYVRDFTNLDFLKYDFADAQAKAGKSREALYRPDGRANNIDLLYELTRKMPSSTVSNYAFRNQGDLTFSNQTAAWGLTNAGVTTGAAYADLDNDGDLDLVTNNTNAPAGVYRNNVRQITKNQYLRVKLTGEGQNQFGTGAKVYLTTGAGQQMQEASPARGYQSSVDQVLHFGLGDQRSIQEIKVVWPGGKVSLLHHIAVNTTLTIRQSDAQMIADIPGKTTLNPLFTDVTNQAGLDFTHRENGYVDFKSEPLALIQRSRLGPKMARGDVNGDGFEDVFIGGAANQSGQLFFMRSSGQFVSASFQPWQQDAACEDTGSLLFDADTDGDLDLYVVSGGSEFPQGAPALQDRLYLNDSQGHFTKAPAGSIPNEYASGSCVTAADFDHDGDLDLFVGGYAKPGQYPEPSPGGILRNETDPKTHRIRFTVATAQVCPALKEPGVVTDALWTDVDGDTWPDLLLVGEWMPIRFFRNQQGILTDQTSRAGLDKSNGFWCRIVAEDMDGDGDSDYLVGNLGENSQLKASLQQPLQLYAGDFNEDGRIDPLICNYIRGASYPIASRDELLDQLGFLRKKFISYASYSDATITDILSKVQLANSLTLSIYSLETSYLENRGNGQFFIHTLPTEAQFSMASGLVTGDFTGDRHQDILLAGNFYPFRVQYGPCDASVGLLLAGDGKGNFRPVKQEESGLFLSGDIRDLTLLRGKGGIERVITSQNNEKSRVLKVTTLTKRSPVAEDT